MKDIGKMENNMVQVNMFWPMVYLGQENGKMVKE